MTYSTLRPSSRNDLFRQIETIFRSSGYIGLQKLTFVCSGMGSGKSNLICHMSKFLDFTGVTCIIEPNELNSKQMISELQKRERHKLNIHIVSWKDKKWLEKIQSALDANQRPVVVFDNIGKHGNAFTPSAKACILLLQKYTQTLVLIDELDSILTELTGGINAKLDHFDTAIEAYTKVCDQDSHSLNIFDEIRKYKAKTIAFSGTLNNVICSKLPSTGYSLQDIDIVNCYPIEELYSKLHIERMDVENFELIKPSLLHHEALENKKILGIFAEEKRIDKFEKDYEKYYGKKNILCSDYIQKQDRA